MQIGCLTKNDPALVWLPGMFNLYFCFASLWLIRCRLHKWLMAVPDRYPCAWCCSDSFSAKTLVGSGASLLMFIHYLPINWEQTTAQRGFNHSYCGICCHDIFKDVEGFAVANAKAWIPERLAAAACTGCWFIGDRCLGKVLCKALIVNFGFFFF